MPAIHSTTRGGKHRIWLVSDLWDKAKDLPVTEIPPRELPEFGHLMSMSAASLWWSRSRDTKGEFTMTDMAFHCDLIMSADLSYPIILNPEGGVMDGCHRILKAHILGEKVRVQQFKEWPPNRPHPAGLGLLIAHLVIKFTQSSLSRAST